MKNLNWVSPNWDFFGKSLLKLAQKSKKEIEVMIGRKPFVIAFSNIK